MNFELQEKKKLLFIEFENDKNVLKLTKQLSLEIQKVLVEAWKNLGLNQIDDSPHISLIAVGGFGRNELFPYSDVDILILIADDNNQYIDAQTQKIEKFISNCWDLGIEIGSSVRTLSECISESDKDITIRTSLLESRFLTGNKKLFKLFETQFFNHLDSKSFFQEKLLELRQRHNKYQNTPYSLEPNIKESPGGLRDLQVILWITKAANLGKSFNDLNKSGVISGHEAKELNKNQKFLQTLRAQMHIIAKRRQDLLTFDVQTPLANSFGLVDNETKRASEQIMRKYYWSAKAVSQLNEILIQNIEALLFPKESQITTRISDFFVERQGFLDIVDPFLFEKNPDHILAAFLVLSKTHGLQGLSTKVLRALYNARDLMNAKWRSSPINRQQFIEIIQQNTGVTRTLTLMNQTSVLGRYLPVFRKIVGQMQHDLFHVYTVDQHIMTVVKNVRRFFVPELSYEFPLCSELAANFDKPWILVIAAIFHDIAKGRGGDHSALGYEEVYRFSKQHHLEKEDADLIAWVVKQHLNMSHVAQKTDISNPEVIKSFANEIKNERYLTALYLLTVADIRGTSPKVWNAWKGKLLEDLYRSTLSFLGGAMFDAKSHLKSKQKEAINSLNLSGILPSDYEEFWKMIDFGFFLKHDSDDIAWLTRNLCKFQNSIEPCVIGRISPIGDGLQICVYVRDQADLFARICAYFDHHGFTIWDAEIYTTKDGYALDTFQISTDSHFDKSRYKDLIQLVEHGLKDSLKLNTPLSDIPKGRFSRQSRIFPIQPRVNLAPDEKGQFYILSFSATDRTGLLYSVAKVLAHHQISLQTAKINTLGERVEDVLLVDGERLKMNPKLQIQIETELIEALNQ